jgi:hypothetical protein
MDNAFFEAFPVRISAYLIIAPLDPVLKDGACGEHAGQTV